MSEHDFIPTPIIFSKHIATTVTPTGFLIKLDVYHQETDKWLPMTFEIEMLARVRDEQVIVVKHEVKA